MLSLSHVTFSYPHKPHLFEDFSWQAERAQAWAVLGPSGGGKTTLLYLLAGLRFPEHGEVRVDGERITRPRPQTGLILQDYGLLPWNTVLDNLLLGLKIRQFYGPDGKHAPTKGVYLPGYQSKAEAEKLARAWIERLGLSGLENQYPGQLSGGQRQRVAIARTLILQPDLLLMDEPFSSLDAATRDDLNDLTLSLWKEQQFTFIVVTHAIEEALRLGQNILLLGTQPHTSPEIIPNPCFGAAEMEDLPDYRALVKDLRARMTQLREGP